MNAELAHIINSGRCFVFVGSGLSSEMGYHSWKELTRLVVDKCVESRVTLDVDLCNQYINDSKYPDALQIVCEAIGEREKFVSLVEGCFLQSQRREGESYKIISRWPFACYLTTNYDNEIFDALQKIGVYYHVIGNEPEDLSLYREGVASLIHKVHGDFSSSANIVLTSSDYDKLHFQGGGLSFRQKMQEIFHMFNIVIIGYGLADKDISFILECAKETASTRNPIHLITAEVSPAKVDEYRRKYNIHTIQYPNHDGNFSNFKKMLRSLDKFIVPRQRDISRYPILALTSDDESVKATSLYLYRTLQGVRIDNLYGRLILNELDRLSGFCSIDQLNISTILNLRSDEEYIALKSVAIDELIHDGFITKSSDTVAMTTAGKDRLKGAVQLRKHEKESAYGQLAVSIREESPSISNENIQVCLDIAENAIVNVYNDRGMAIARRVYGRSSANADDLSAFFRVFTQQAAILESYDDKLAFIDSMYTFLINPNGVQRNYLASLAQGYFLYHLLGLDPQCIAVRRNILEETIWLCDSSILIPLLAIGSFNHDFVKRVFSLLEESKCQVYTTPNLLEETVNHMKWAADFVRQYPTKSVTFLSAATVEEPYKQNLFIDGYIRQSVDSAVDSFEEYLQIVCHGSIGLESMSCVLSSYGVRLVTLNQVQGYKEEDAVELELLTQKLKHKRQNKGTYRNQSQVSAEAEVLLLLKGLTDSRYNLGKGGNNGGSNFITSSHLFEETDDTGGNFSWTPKAVYQYLSTFSDTNINPELLQQANLLAFYDAGVEFIDKEKYEKYFGQMIESSKRDFEHEKKSYANYLKTQYANQSDDESQMEERFSLTPDLKKPLVMERISSELLAEAQRREEIARKVNQDLKAQVAQLEREKRSAWKDRKSRQAKQEAATIRNLSDPKHIAKLKRRKQKKGK